MFPSDLQNNTEFRDEIRGYLIYDGWLFLVNLQKDVLSFGCKVIPGNFQFIFALLIPFAKEMNVRVLSKLVARIVGKEDEEADVLFSLYLNIHYEFFVAIRMNGAETETMMSIVFVDLLLQLLMMYKLIQLNRQVTNEVERNEAIDNWKDKAFRKLV